MNWLQLYGEYTEPYESPDLFHLWSGVAAIAACLARNVWIDMGGYTVYPNHYVILVGASALCKKSSAIRLPLDIINQIPDPPPIMSQKISPEALINQLKTHGGKCFIVSDELEVFLGADALISGMLPILTDLWDCPERSWRYTTISRATEIINRPCVNLLGGSTPDWLRRCIPASAVGGGFTSRVIFVWGKDPRDRNLFQPHPDKERKEKLLVKELTRIREMSGPFEITDDGKSLLEDWYSGLKVKMRSSELPDLMSGYYGRKHTHLLKLSMIVSAACSSDRVIDTPHIEVALDLLNNTEADMIKPLDYISQSEGGGDAAQVLSIIERHGSIERAMLTKRLWRRLDAKRIREAIEVLVDGGLIRVVEKGRRILYEFIGKSSKAP